MKHCGSCGSAKPLSEFHRRGRGYQTWCKLCRQRYDADYYRRTRERRLAQKQALRAAMVAWYQDIKSRTPCADCGGYFHHAAMACDHLPGTVKIDDVSSLARRYSWKAMLAEIAKCELVCANCHAVRSFRRLRGVAQPG